MYYDNSIQTLSIEFFSKALRLIVVQLQITHRLNIPHEQTTDITMVTIKQSKSHEHTVRDSGI